MCVKRRHTDLNHAVFVAVAMWGSNRCSRCLSSPERQSEGYGFLMDEQVALGASIVLVLVGAFTHKRNLHTPVNLLSALVCAA